MMKFSEEIIKEIRKRGNIKVPKGYITGESFEKWLYKTQKENNDTIDKKK